VVGNKSVENLAEREGFPAFENADCTLCCWEGHSTLCYTAHGSKGKSEVRHSAVKPLGLRSGPSWTNRTNKSKASSLSAILSWCNRRLHQQLISEFGELAADRYITSCLPLIHPRFVDSASRKPGQGCRLLTCSNASHDLRLSRGSGQESLQDFFGNLRAPVFRKLLLHMATYFRSAG